VTALHFASNFGHSKTVKVLLAGGAEVDARTNSQLTPLNLAEGNVDPEMIVILESWTGRLLKIPSAQHYRRIIVIY